MVDAAAGIAIGLAAGWLVGRLRTWIRDAPTEIAITLITPYLAYLPAEAAGVSAVLAAVTCGVYLGWQAPKLVDPATRLQSFAVWETVVFLLNSFLFVLVGLELPTVLEGLTSESASTLLRDGLLVAATVIVVRMVWVFPAMLVPDRWSHRVAMRDPRSPVRSVVLIGWTGMRGALSMAAALALPTTIDAGGPFPGRSLVIFLVYAVILATLLGQGLTLPRLIRWAGVSDDEHEASGAAWAAAALPGLFAQVPKAIVRVVVVGRLELGQLPGSGNPNDACSDDDGSVVIGHGRVPSVWAVRF